MMDFSVNSKPLMILAKVACLIEQGFAYLEQMSLKLLIFLNFMHFDALKTLKSTVHLFQTIYEESYQ